MAPRTREELVSLAIMHPALTAALEKGPPIRPPKPSDPYYGRTDHTALREHRAAILKEKWALRYLPGSIAEVTEQDRTIPARDGSEITTRVYKPVRGGDSCSSRAMCASTAVMFPPADPPPTINPREGSAPSSEAC